VFSQLDALKASVNAELETHTKHDSDTKGLLDETAPKRTPEMYSKNTSNFKFGSGSNKSSFEEDDAVGSRLHFRRIEEDCPEWEDLKVNALLRNLNEQILDFKKLLVESKEKANARNFICRKENEILKNVAKAFTETRAYFRTLDRPIVSHLWMSLQRTFKDIEIFINLYCNIASPLDGLQHQPLPQIIKNYIVGNHMIADNVGGK
jgi:hypothetical protein